MKYNHLANSYRRLQAERAERLQAQLATNCKGALASQAEIGAIDKSLVLSDARRLNAAILTLDISGFSNRRSISLLEQTMTLINVNLFLTQMAYTIADYGGSIEKIAGDGLMAYFEERVELSAVQRAVSCALAMDAVNREIISPLVESEGISPLFFRAAIDYGTVTLARVGGISGLSSWLAIGNVANFAVKMLDLIKAGDTALGASAWLCLSERWRQNWAECVGIRTGWVFASTMSPYPIYLHVPAREGGQESPILDALAPPDISLGPSLPALDNVVDQQPVFVGTSGEGYT